MRRYDEPVDVRKGMVDGSEGPEQFVWRDRLWKVHSVLAHWVETGAWWESAGARAALGTEPAGTASPCAGSSPRPETAGAVLSAAPALLTEQEVWRVEASRGRLSAAQGTGVFDLTFDWAAGAWRLTGCLD
jgi:hypothetical protein